MIIRYDSTAALRADYIAKRAKGSTEDRSWYGNESEADTLRLAEVGDTRLVPKAGALLSSLETVIETPRKVWERSPAGAFCSVPDAIVGLPLSMRRQASVQDDVAPITILAITTSSAGIDADVLARRGTTILALVIALSRIRPVSLYQICAVHGKQDGETIITSEINTHPLDLASACYVLTSAGFARRLTYGLARVHNDFNGMWPRAFNFRDPEPYYTALKPRLVADPSRCLIIGAAQLGDMLLNEPVKWLNNQIRRFTEQEDA